MSQFPLGATKPGALRALQTQLLHSQELCNCHSVGLSLPNQTEMSVVDKPCCQVLPLQRPLSFGGVWEVVVSLSLSCKSCILSFPDFRVLIPPPGSWVCPSSKCVPDLERRAPADHRHALHLMAGLYIWLLLHNVFHGIFEHVELFLVAKCFPQALVVKVTLTFTW